MILGLEMVMLNNFNEKNGKIVMFLWGIVKFPVLCSSALKYKKCNAADQRYIWYGNHRTTKITLTTGKDVEQVDCCPSVGQ